MLVREPQMAPVFKHFFYSKDRKPPQEAPIKPPAFPYGKETEEEDNGLHQVPLKEYISEQSTAPPMWRTKTASAVDRGPSY